MLECAIRVSGDGDRCGDVVDDCSTMGDKV